MKPNMKKIPAALTSLALAGQLCFPGAALAAEQPRPLQGDVMVSDVFTDPILRSWILSGNNLGGMGADGVLTQEERQAVTSLDLSGMNLTSLEGLEAFPNLQSLDCSRNALTALDLSQNPALTTLNCSYNQLTHLDLSRNPEISHLNCSFNRMTELDLTGRAKLVALNCEMNQLTKLTLAGCSGLVSLYCRNNLLDKLDLSDNLALEFIETFSNRLTSIDVTMLAQLRFLHIDHNQLTHLDMSQNRKLEGGGFVARNNFVETILLPDQPGLIVYLDDYGEQDPIDGADRVEWYLDPSYTDPAPEQLEAAGQTLYSKRIPNQYTVYFSANGGAGSMSSQTAKWGDTFKLPEQTFRRYGYTFSHWSTLPNQDHDTYDDGAEVSNLAGQKTDGDRITLYARWTANRYSIRLDPNGGEGEPQILGAAYDQNVNLPQAPFTKADMEFAGWAASEDGPVRYADQAQVQNLTAQADETVTLYAVWRTPINQIQKTYLETLERAFRAYDTASYTGEDWETLSNAYTAAVGNIQSASLETAMKKAVEQGLSVMEAVPTLEKRVGAVTSGWQSAHNEVLNSLSSPILSETNAQQESRLAQAALDGLEQDALSAFCSLSRPEDRTTVVSRAAQQLQETAEKLRNLQQAARWVADLNGLTTISMEQVQPEQLTGYQAALESYQGLPAQVQGAVSPGVSLALHSRHELAGQKHTSLLTLQSAYDGLEQSAYSDKGKAALARELADGQAAIRAAGSAELAQQAQNSAWERILQVPTADKEPSEPVTPPAGGGGGIGGGGSGGAGGSAPVTPPAADGTVTITDKKTGASALVTTTETGTVHADVTIPQGVSHATLRIPCKGGVQTVAVVVGTDGSRSVLPKSVYQDGVLIVRMDRSARIKLLDNGKSFSDVRETDWFAPSVAFTASRELFSGVGNDMYAPDGTMTRAMLATVLHRLEGEPDAAASGMFQDVPQGIWYTKAVNWAAETGLVAGVGSGQFAPDAPITRESLALMLYRCAGSPQLAAGGAAETLERFPDADRISAWARDAMEWACTSGILTGDSGGQLRPGDFTTRAEVSAMLTRFVGQTLL